MTGFSSYGQLARHLDDLVNALLLSGLGSVRKELPQTRTLLLELFATVVAMGGWVLAAAHL